MHIFARPNGTMFISYVQHFQYMYTNMNYSKTLLPRPSCLRSRMQRQRMTTSPIPAKVVVLKFDELNDRYIYVSLRKLDGCTEGY